MGTKILALLMLLLAGSSNAQETPAYYVPNFTPNITYRTNFCKLHVGVENGEIELRNALKGAAVTVGFTSYQLNAEGAIDEENPNIVFRLMDELAARAGFVYRNNYGKVDIGENETFSDVLFYATDVYDVLGDWWTENTARLERHIVYPDGWYNANLIMVGKTGKSSEFNFYSLAAPFTPDLWGLVALTTVVSAIVYYVLDYFDSRIKGRPMDMGLESSLFFTAFLLGGNYVHQPKSRSTRILVFSMAFFFFFVVACYTANLASFLVEKNQQVVINDIQDVIRNDLTLCVERGTGTDEYLKAFRIQPRHLLRTVSEGDTYLEGSAYLALLEGKCDFVFTSKGTFDAFKRSQQYNPECDLAQIGRIQKMRSAGFALKDSEQYCTSIVRDVLHLHMLEMKDSGEYDKIWKSSLDQGTTNSCSERARNGGDREDNGDTGLGVANLSGVFALHAAAMVISILITVFNFCRQPERKRKKMITELQSGTSLNRVVAFAAENGSGAFSLGKSNRQTPGASGRTAVSDQSCPKMQETVVRNLANADGGPSRLANSVDLDEINKDDKTTIDSLAEESRQNKMLIEKLLIQLQRMEEREDKIDERLEARIQILEKKDSNNDVKNY